jgi:DNA polymerase III subunit alpha, Gram-positive type
LQHESATTIVLDTETTGLDHKTEKLIEIAAVKMVDGIVVDQFNSLINPEKEIRHSSFLIHHISDEDVKTAPTIDVVLPQFMEFVGNAPFVAHNAIFDYSFINEPMKQLYGKRFENPRIDTLEMYRAVFPDEHSHGLSSLLRRFGHDDTVTHRALDDALCLAKVYEPLKLLYEEKYAWQLSQLPNVNYLVERYMRIQKACQLMHAEMSDLKEVFKLYFQHHMVSNYRRSYSYNDNKVWDLALEHDFYKKVFKLNPRALDKVIDRSDLDAEIKQALIDCRISMHEAKGVNFVKPQAKTPDLDLSTELPAEDFEE